MLKLITLLGSGIPAIIAGIVSFITRKVGTAAGSITAFTLLTLTFIACINLIFTSLSAALSAPLWVSNAVGMFVPSNFSAVVAAIFSAKTCRAAYDMARFKIKLINDAS